MKIVLIRAAEADFTWPRRLDSVTIDAAWAELQKADIAPIGISRADAESYAVYTGTAPAAIQTAEALFTRTAPPVRTPLLDEIPSRSFRDTARRYPLWLWDALARLQWRFGSSRQPETKRDTLLRAREAIALAEISAADCVLIVPPRFLRVLAGELERRGYCVEGLPSFGDPKPLDRVRAMKQDAHCGGCIHNCLLANPGCGIGLTKAKDRGIVPRR